LDVIPNKNNRMNGIKEVVDDTLKEMLRNGTNQAVVGAARRQAR
jgi:hypothetical protein